MPLRPYMDTAKNPGVIFDMKPPYNKEEKRAFAKYHDDMSFVFWDKNSGAVIGSDETDLSYVRSYLQFTLPKSSDEEWIRRKDILPPRTEKQQIAFERFHEGDFLIYDPNTRILYESITVPVGFNGPNVSFNLPKKTKRS